MVGTVAACSLLLLACSWFVVDGGSFRSNADVGAPTPVHLEGTTPARDVSARRAGVPPAQRSTRADVSTKRNASVRAASTQHPGLGGRPIPGNGPNGSQPSAGRATQPNTGSTPLSSPPPPAVTVPQLPAPVDDLPVPPLQPVPPVAPLPAVSQPAVPVPDVPTVTTILGSP